MVEAKTRAGKKIVIQSMGTRGDAQPMAAIGLKLLDAGYDVTIFTNKDSVAFVESMGVKARHVFYDFEAECNTGKMKESQEVGDFNMQVVAVREANEKHGAEMTKLWYEAVGEIKPDVCISGTLCDFLGMVMCRHFKVPTMTIALQPIPANPPKMIFGLMNIPCCGLNRCIINIVSKQMVQGEADTYGGQLKKQYGMDWTKLFTKEEVSESRIVPPAYRPILVGCDPLIAYCLYGGEQYVPPTVKLLGFFAVDQEKQVGVAKEGGLQKQKSNQFGDSAELDAIDAFCKAGTPPLYLGFGSMIAGSPEKMVTLLCGAAKIAGARAIICKGWAKLSQALLEKATKDTALIEYAKANIMFVGNTPHPWLFPKCSCIIHHGGAGTTCTASRAGTPQIIIPVWCDQWDMAHFLNEYGTGFGFSKQLMKVTAQEVGEAIKKVVTNEKIKAKAKQWGEVVWTYPGSQGVVQELEAWWEKEVVSGKWQKSQDDAFKALGGK